MPQASLQMIEYVPAVVGVLVTTGRFTGDEVLFFTGVVIMR